MSATHGPNDEITLKIPLDGSSFDAHGPWNTPSFSFAIQNYSTQSLTITDDSGDVQTIAAGDVRVINRVAWKYIIKAGGTGAALITLYNYTQEPQNAIGNVVITGPVTVTGNVGITGTVTVTGSVSITGTVTVAGAVSVSGSVSITGPVTISGTVTVTGTVTFSNTSINVQNVPGNILTVTQAALIVEYDVLDNSTKQITLTRQTGRIVLQPVIATLARGGLLSLWATDSMTQTHWFLNNIGYESTQSGLPVETPDLPYRFEYSLPSGAILNLKYTGNMGFITGY